MVTTILSQQPNNQQCKTGWSNGHNVTERKLGWNVENRGRYIREKKVMEHKNMICINNRAYHFDSHVDISHWYIIIDIQPLQFTQEFGCHKIFSTGLGPDLLRNPMLKSMLASEHVQTWLLIGWQQTTSQSEAMLEYPNIAYKTAMTRIRRRLDFDLTKSTYWQHIVCL